MKKLGKYLIIIMLLCMLVALLSPYKDMVSNSGILSGNVSLSKPDSNNGSITPPIDYPSVPLSDIRNKTIVSTSTSYFQGNEMQGLIWSQYDLSQVKLTNEDNITTYDGVLTSEKNQFTYQVPTITNRLTDQILFPNISYWDINQFVAYDFTISTSSEYPNGIAFTLLSADSSGNYDLTGEKLYIERLNGKDTLFKSCFLVYWEEDPIPEEDWKDPAIPEYELEKYMKIENIEIGTLETDVEYQFTFVIETDRYTFSESYLDYGHSVYATYAYVYLNGEYLTTLGFNINENSTKEQGWDVEYALGIMFDTRYKTVNPGSNLIFSNLLTAGTKSADYFDGNNLPSAANYYIADLFKNDNRFIPLSYNPDWYYSDVIYQSDISSSSPLNTEVSYYTQTQKNYQFKDETVSASRTIYVLDDYFQEPFSANNRTYCSYDTNSFWYLGENSKYILSLELYVGMVPSSRIEIFWGNNCEYSGPRMYLIPKSINGTSLLQVAFEQNGQMRYYGYLAIEESYLLTFSLEVDGIAHIYVDGKWLTSLANFLPREQFNVSGEYRVGNLYISCDDSDNIWNLEFSNLTLSVYDDSKITSEDTFVEYIFSNPLFYLYYNPDYSYYDLRK